MNKHRDEPGVREAFDDLNAAKTNYVQRSIDHMINSLVLTLHDLLVHAPTEKLKIELSTAIRGYVAGIFQSGSKLSELARQYEANGGKLLSHDEILKEVDDGRGASR